MEYNVQILDFDDLCAFPYSDVYVQGTYGRLVFMGENNHPYVITKKGGRMPIHAGDVLKLDTVIGTFVALLQKDDEELKERLSY